MYPSASAAPMPSSPPHSTLVLPQHILANPLDTLGRQAPLAALFALNARFVDESAGIVSSCLLLLSPAHTSVHHLRESISKLCAFSKYPAFVAPCRNVMGIESSASHRIASYCIVKVCHRRYVLLHKQHIIQIYLRRTLVSHLSPLYNQ